MFLSPLILAHLARCMANRRELVQEIKSSVAFICQSKCSVSICWALASSLKCLPTLLQVWRREDAIRSQLLYPCEPELCARQRNRGLVRARSVEKPISIRADNYMSRVYLQAWALNAQCTPLKIYRDATAFWKVVARENASNLGL